MANQKGRDRKGRSGKGREAREGSGGAARAALRRLLPWAMVALAAAALGLVLWEVGFTHEAAGYAFAQRMARYVLFALAALFALRVALAEDRRAFLLAHRAEGIVLGLSVALLLTLYAWQGGTWPSGADAGGQARAYRYALRLGLLGSFLLIGGQRAIQHVSLRVRASVALLGMFALFIAGGTLLLMMPAASVAPGPMPLVDALFTATSAVCVTGLTVVPMSPTFTPLGEGIVLGLIQVGGIGIVSAASGLTFAFGGRGSVSARAMLHDVQDTRTLGEVRSLFRYIVLAILGIEAVGAVLIFVAVDLPFESVGARVYYSVFHAVSAFCNAGFSTRPESLALPETATDLDLNLVFMALIVIGGTGFVVLQDTFSLRRWRQGRFLSSGYSVQSRLVWIMTLALIVVGAAVLFWLEGDGALAAAPGAASTAEAVLAAFFQSVTARTAGFNTVPTAEMGAAASAFLIGLMFIGASPGSTGGGIKTTTFALLFLFARGEWRGRHRADVFHRTIGARVVRRAFAVVLFALACVGASTFLLLITEPGAPALDVMFEATSAFATVGLSRGLTGELSTAGRLIIVADMYLGRVGLLALAAYLTTQTRRVPYRYPEETVMVA